MCIVPKSIVDWFMIMLLLVLKLLVVLLYKFRQARYHSTMLYYDHYNLVDVYKFHVMSSWLVDTFHWVAWLLSLLSIHHAIVKDLIIAFTIKNYFVIIYLLEDEQELSLGMLIRPKRIYNFWLFHAIFMLLALVFILSLLFIGLTY